MKIDYLLSFILLVFSVLTLVSCIYAFAQYRKNKERSVAWLIVFSFNVFVYCFSYSMELISVTLNAMFVFNTLKIIAIALLQSVTLCMIVAILYPRKKFKVMHYIIFFLIPALTIIFRLTSDYHTLYYYNFSVDSEGAFNKLKFDLGPWNYVYGVHGIIISLIAVGFLIKDYIVDKHKRTRSILIIIAVLCPLILGTLTILEVYVFGIILLPFAFPITALCFYIAIFNHQLFNIIPLAYKKVFELTDAGILVMDNELNIIGYNKSFGNIFPQVDILNYEYNIEDLVKEYSELAKTIYDDDESKIKVLNGGINRHYTVDNSYLFNKKNIKTGQILSFVDVTELVETMAQLSKLAFIDTLTGAKTRRYFDEHAKLELERAKRYDHPIALMIMDLDHFKKVNDKYGHLAGDKVLKTISGICMNVIRENDIFCRYGGEEFVVLMSETNVDSAKALAMRIRKLVEETEVEFNKQKIKITISIGYSGINRVYDESLDLLIKHADTALYTAKMNGRNRVEFLAYDEPID